VSDYDEIIEKQIIAYYLEYHKNIFVFKIPDYGSRCFNILEDIRCISNANIVKLNNNISWSDLGNIKNIIIRNNEIVLLDNNNSIKNQTKKLKNELSKCTSEYDKEFIESRLAKLENGIATIYVGGITKTEIKEKIMRYVDALNSLEISKKGILLGEGITFLKISNYLSENVISEKIIKEALMSPFDTIFINAGIDNKNIKNSIVNSNYSKIYDFYKD
jgi:chaperonin GroEL